MIRTITRPITRPITRAITRAFEKTRYLIDLNGTDAYYELAQPITFAIGDTLEFDYSGNLTGNNNFFLRNAANEFLGVFTDDTYNFEGFTLEVDGVAKTNLVSVVYNDTDLHGFKLTATVATTVTILMARGDTLVGSVGGIIANVKFTDLGSQLFSTFTSLDAGSSYVAGVLTLVQNAGQDFAVSDVSIVSGTKYTIDYEVTSQDIDTGGELKVTTSVGNTTKVLLPHTVGEHSVTFTADANYTMTLRLGNTNNGRVVVGDSWSVRETDNIVTTTFALDEPTANTELSVESGGVSTTGGELVVNGGFDDGLSGWDRYGDASSTLIWDSGRALCNAATASDGMSQRFVGVIGATYRILIDFELGTSPTFLPQIGGGTTISSGAISPTQWELITIAPVTNPQLRLIASVGTFWVDNISIKLASPSITYNNIAEADRELYQEEATEFVNISPAPQQLPAIITKA